MPAAVIALFGSPVCHVRRARRHSLPSQDRSLAHTIHKVFCNHVICLDCLVGLCFPKSEGLTICLPEFSFEHRSMGQASHPPTQRTRTEWEHTLTTDTSATFVTHRVLVSAHDASVTSVTTTCVSSRDRAVLTSSHMQRDLVVSSEKFQYTTSSQIEERFSKDTSVLNRRCKACFPPRRATLLRQRKSLP